MHNELQKWFLKDAQLDFIRALVRPQKGTFCNSIGRLLEAKRVCVGFELVENSLQISVHKGTIKRKTPLHCS